MSNTGEVPSSYSDQPSPKHVAGNINYRQWDKVASHLVEDAEQEEQEEQKHASRALGLDGKYAVSQADADERHKAKEVRHAKRVLDKYKRREGQAQQQLEGLLGPPEKSNTSTTSEPKVVHAHAMVRLTRERVDAGKRVLTLCDTSGESREDVIVLTQDLSHLESKMAANAMATRYSEDAENEVKEETTEMRSVFGLIKVFLSNVHNCTVIVRCKIISGTIEMNHCSNVLLRIEKEATVATIQADLCQDVAIEFHDAPSGKNSGLPAQNHQLYWGDDTNDRIFHAGVKNMKISLFRDGFLETEATVDYLKDGATAVGNATPEEFQFVTSVVEEELVTEQVVRHGGTTGKNARAMTQRELDEEQERRQKAADMAIEKALQFQEKGDAKNKEARKIGVETVQKGEEEIEEVFTSMSKSEIDAIVAECEANKTRGNEAFAAGEYAQAILLYSLALDKAEELPDKGAMKQLFQRHVVLSNRSASFLKMGEHEKALADATRAQEMDPTYVKAIFRRGLALHAMGRYEEAIPVLVEAQKIEPKNKQIQQALQFAEIRMTQEMRKRMGQS